MVNTSSKAWVGCSPIPSPALMRGHLATRLALWGEREGGGGREGEGGRQGQRKEGETNDQRGGQTIHIFHT